MDSPKRTPPQGSPRRSPSARRPGGATEADENADPARPVPAGNASPLRKKVLGERNCGGVEAATPPPQPKPVPSPPALTGRGAGPYDPKTNCTTPRPEFLRYDPERHREMLLRLARAAEVTDEDDCSSAASGAASPEDTDSSVSSVTGGDSEDNLDDGYNDEEEEEVVPAGRDMWARRLFLLFFAVACSCCYIYCMHSTPFHLHSEDSLALTGPIVGIHDADVHELDSVWLSGLGPLDMMGPEDVLDETASPIVQGGSEGAAHQYDPRAASRNLMAIAMMGLADMCLNVQLGESTCRIGDVNTENVDGPKGNSALSEQNAAVMESLENDTRNISWHSSGLTSTQTIDMEGDSSGLVHQEEGEDYSNQLVPQLVSLEKAMGSSSDKLNSGMGLEREGLDLDTELLWQYEQTAEAAKEICSKVKYLWAAMEPHLLWILVCLSVTGFVATLFKFKYRLRAREIAMPTSQQMSSKSLKEVLVLAPHQTVQLSVSPSSPAVQLQVPKQHLSGSLEVPMELPLPKSGPLALPTTDPVQKLQKGDAELKASLGSSKYHRDNDSSNTPVVQLLGEFSFGNSSKRKPIRTPVQESKESFVGDVDKWPKNSSIIQTLSVGRARKEERTLKGEKDLTATSLRRSSRLLNKVTSP